LRNRGFRNGARWIEKKVGIDIWRPALETFKNNHPYSKDSYKVEKEIDCLIGGPPCQAFSTVGKRALDDRRALLVKEFARIVREIKPQIFVFENVKGFPSFAKGQLLKEIPNIFDSLGYEIDYGVLNAVNYGVPQNREIYHSWIFRPNKSIITKTKYQKALYLYGCNQRFTPFVSWRILR